jgi:hypothetical protein
VSAEIPSDLLTGQEHQGSQPGFGQVCVAYLFSSLCCVLVCLFVCLFVFCHRPVSCVPNVTSLSGLSILDITFGFL